MGCLLCVGNTFNKNYNNKQQLKTSGHGIEIGIKIQSFLHNWF